MSPVPEWERFPKIPRMNRDCIVTEKMDGTNAAIRIDEDGSIRCFSKKVEITPEQDNHTFARWVHGRAEQIVEFLGPGLHRGEFCGPGINKNRHGLDEKEFVLFNAKRFAEAQLPQGVGVVPVLYEGPFDTQIVNDLVAELRDTGTRHGRGRAEGVIVFHLAASMGFKVTCEKDETWKGNPQRIGVEPATTESDTAEVKA